MRTITIERKKWLRGPANKADGKYFASVLYDGEAKAGCCLGHVIHQVKRCSWDSLESLASPADAACDTIVCSALINKDQETGCISNNKLSDSAMIINDGSTINDKDREKQLKALFKEHKIKLVFKGRS